MTNPRMPVRRMITQACACAALCTSGLPAHSATTDIENGLLKVQYNSSSGQVSLFSKNSGTPFFSSSQLRNASAAALTKVKNATFGSGEAIEVTHPNGNRTALALFPDLPFVVVRAAVRNTTAGVLITNRLPILSGTVELGRPASQLATLGTGGLLAPDRNPGSYMWLATANPNTRRGVIFGWLANERGSGILFSRTNYTGVEIDAVLEYGRLLIRPGQAEDLEPLAIGYFDDARLGLESWADAVAKVHKVRLKPQPTGYCTWYSRPYGGAADEEHLAELASFSATNLARFGFSVVQIDDGWQSGFKRSSPSSPKKDFRTHNPRGPYPAGMKSTADRVKSLGLVPGLWFMPFAGTLGDPFFDAHLDWFAKTPVGQPYDTPWGGACLDMTHPGARGYVRDLVSRICRDWGYHYIKIDGLWTGTATKQLYVNSGYKPDDLGEAVLSDSTMTPVESFRSGLKLVREAAGENVFILGCNAPQNMRSYGGAFGLVDAMRVGPDNSAEWKSLLRGPTFGTRHYFLHRRIWYNDPDPVYVRESMPVNQAQLICSWVALSGQLNLSSEWIPGLPPDRLDILKRTMPSHQAVARPVDLFENDLPEIWTVTAPGRTVVGLFNWDDAERQFNIPLEQLGLNTKVEYAAFDYWGNSFIPSVSGKLGATVPARSCVVFAMRPMANHPQVVSTSRHVTQGMIELSGETWDQKARILSGQSELIGHDPCELRIAAGAAKMKRISLGDGDQAANVSATIAQTGPLARLTIKSPSTRKVSWKVEFN